MRLRSTPSPLPSGGLLFVYDLLAVGVAITLAFLLRFETLDLASAIGRFLPAALLPLVIRPLVGMEFGLYRREWRFASIRELRDVVVAVGVGSVGILVVFVILAAVGLPGTDPFPRSFFILEPILALMLFGGGRFALRLRLENAQLHGRRNPTATPTLIYGAGDAGAALAQLAARDPAVGIRIVGYLDDDRRKQGSRLHGLRVLGGIDDLQGAVSRTGARQLLIAMPSRAGNPIRRAVTRANELGLEVKTVPPMRDLLTGRVQAAPVRQVGVEDLLRREPVGLDAESMTGYLNSASVLVTGGGGSIGGELVRQIARIGPRELTIVDYHEAALWGIERDLSTILRPAAGVRTEPILADVRSADAMRAIISRTVPDVVFHAAALKHVPYVEMHPSEGVLTNVIGTRNLLDACESAGVGRLVVISTDKAVEPSSVMGRTKRVAELLAIEAGHRLGRPYSAVRFGNVLGSSGSLIPLIERQLDDALPLTITEPDATRYFMTLSEAVTLILQAGAATAPGEVYVLDMGDPVRIGDLVRDLVRLKGIAEETVQYQVTGLRPGEKLHEKLFFDSEASEPTEHPGILRAVSRRDSTLLSRLPAFIADLASAAHSMDDRAVRSMLEGYVEGRQISLHEAV